MVIVNYKTTQMVMESLLHKKKRKQKRCSKCVDLKMYDNNPKHKCLALGRGRECDYFDDHGKRRCWRCWKHGLGGLDPYTCPATIGNSDDCERFRRKGNGTYHSINS